MLKGVLRRDVPYRTPSNGSGDSGTVLQEPTGARRPVDVLGGAKRHSTLPKLIDE